MTTQNPFMALILLTSLLCANGHTNEFTTKKTTDTLLQVAQDAILITISEISTAKAFLDSIPRLKSIQNLRGTHDGDDDLVGQCVGGLSDAMNNVIRELKIMDKLDSPRSLENSVNGVVSFNDVCSNALADVDDTIKLMVFRKLEDIVLLTNDVIFRFAVIHHFDAKVTEKP